ncbi:MAG TPA: ABC-2 family transporter protein [Polyangiaceae bacterium]|nr:ABC-2 family transporter protein [Polyangiaceae bacterium]
MSLGSASFSSVARRALRAYPTLLRVGLSEAVAYRAEFVVWMLTTTMPLVSLALWSAVASSAPVGRFGSKEFVAYFLAALVVRQLTGTWLIWEMNQDIRSGALSQRLLKPIHPLVAYSAQSLGAMPLRAALAVPMALVALAYSTENMFRGHAGMVALWVMSLLGAWLINFFVMALIGALAFYMESSLAAFEVYFACFMVLSGYMVPLPLFPDWLIWVSSALPFRYSVGFPVEVAIGMLEPKQALIELGVQWAYVVATLVAALAAFRRGVARFGAFGG